VFRCGHRETAARSIFLCTVFRRLRVNGSVAVCLHFFAYTSMEIPCSTVISFIMCSEL